jgi:hypothetical protein
MLTASVYSTRSSSKIALGDIHFGKSTLVACSTNHLSHAAPRQRYWCVFCAYAMARMCTIMMLAKAARIYRVLTRPSHLPQPNPFRTCRAAARRCCWPSYHPERRWTAPRSAATCFDGSQSRSAHPRAPREYLCQSSQAMWHFFLFLLMIEGAIEQQKVHCQHGHVYPRTVFQEWLGQANPRWRAFLTELERTGAQPRTNPDGDVCYQRQIRRCKFIS